MAEKFEVEVPISVKGGLGGDDTGKKVVASVAGLSKGLKGIVTKFGVIGAAITAAVGLLAKASPYLKGILSIFGRAFMIFFRPFGDFLATLLRPLAILLMKMAVAFLKWTRPVTGAVREAVAEVPQITPTGLALPDIAIGIANWALKLGAALGAVIYEIGKGAFDIGVKIGQWLYDKVILPVANSISNFIIKAFGWVEGIGSKIWTDILKPAWDWFKDIGTKIWDILKSPFEELASLIRSTLGKIKSFIKSFSGGEGAETRRRPLILPILQPDPFGIIGKLLGIGKGQVGIPSVPSEGLYHLHKGEEVVPRTKAGQGRSVIFKPTFQITGNIAQDIDMDAIVRRASRMTEMELKQRGVI